MSRVGSGEDNQSRHPMTAEDQRSVEDVVTALGSDGSQGLTSAEARAFNARSGDESAFRGLFKNGSLWGAVTLSVALQVLVVYTPFLQRAFSTEGLSASDWLRCVVVASSVLWLRELEKILRALGRAHPQADQYSTNASST